MRRRTPLVILFAAAVFYLFLVPRFDVGHFQDDSLHITAARSLLQGHYRALYHPEHPPIFAELPGYPLWISPWVAIFQPHWAHLKIVSIVVTLLAGAFLWIWARRWTSEAAANLALGLFAFNPSVVYFSSAVMTELCFLLFILLLLLSFERLLKTGTAAQWSTWGLVLGWAALMRPEGLTLWLAFGAVLAWKRRWNACLYGAGIAVILWGLGEIRMGGESGYLGFLQRVFRGSGPALVVSQGANVLSNLLTQAIVPLPFPMDPGLWTAAHVVIGVLIGFLLLLGIQEFWTAAGFSRESKAALLLFAALDLGSAMVWVAFNLRHLIPIMAFALAMASAAALRLWRGSPGARLVAAAMGILTLTCFAFQDVRAVAETLHPLAENRVWRETFSWISQNTPEDRRFLAFRAPMLHLYTGRQAYSEFAAGDAYRFRYELLHRGIGDVVYEPLQVNVIQAAGAFHGNFWSRAQGWLSAWPAAFPVLYVNSGERTTVYEATPDARYTAAYGLYLSARRDGEEGRWKESDADLKAADALWPKLPPVENARGLAAWQGRGDRRTAEKYFRSALSRKELPFYGVAAVNLSRLYAEMGRNAEAARFAAEAAAGRGLR